MTDIDFDELDRAVNSLVGSQSSQPEPSPSVSSPSPTPTSSPIVSAAASAQSGSVSAPAPSDTPSSAPAARPVAPIQPRGRFLDVVHPQSQMARPAAASTTRVAPALTPLGNPKPPISTFNPTTPVPADISAPVTPVEPSVVSDPTPEPTLPVSEPEVVPTSAASTFIADAEPAPEPLVPEGPSPFLSDAVVEKRPLGAFTGSETTSLLSASEAALEIPDPAPKEVERAKPMPSVPAELSGDLVALESETVTPSSPAQSGGGFGAVGAFSGDSESAAQASGIQSVFSTGKNGKPLPKPKGNHGHRGWLWLLVGGVVVLIAAGVGVTFYLFVLK